MTEDRFLTSTITLCKTEHTTHEEQGGGWAFNLWHACILLKHVKDKTFSPHQTEELMSLKSG